MQVYAIINKDDYITGVFTRDVLRKYLRQFIENSISVFIRDEKKPICEIRKHIQLDHDTIVKQFKVNSDCEFRTLNGLDLARIAGIRTIVKRAKICKPDKTCPPNCAKTNGFTKGGHTLYTVFPAERTSK